MEFQGKTGNLCVDSGCKADCCKNVRLDVTEEELVVFPKAQYVPNNEKLEAESRKGVFYTKNGTNHTYSVRIIGRCPNLQANNNCGVYALRPEACDSGFDIGSKECASARDRFGRQPVIINISDIK